MSDSGSSFNYYDDNKLTTSCFSPLPQFDGPIDVLDDSLTAAALNIHTRIDNFELNHAKQAEKIVNDANNPDFDIKCNDNNRNININCNSGFYLQVAKPSLHQLATDSIDETLGIS